ncbi:MAG: hypothetical protein DBW63_15465 [Hyphomonas sp.]|nr:MAG: hypothetical protein DBW63_15465 [Hyphomonas sp.]
MRGFDASFDRLKQVFRGFCVIDWRYIQAFNTVGCVLRTTHGDFVRRTANDGRRFAGVYVYRVICALRAHFYQAI